MKVKDVMHKGAFWVGPDTTVAEIATLMRKNDIGGVPIGEDDRIIGMVTAKDIVCKGIAKKGFDAGRATARDVMTEGIHCCGEEDDHTRAGRKKKDHKVTRLPVIKKKKRMVGILTQGDFARSAPH